MKVPNNIENIANLSPDYMGFIFYKKSPRYFDDQLPVLPKSIKKTGVFVNATTQEITSRVKKFGLQAVQLHGDEKPDYCRQIKEQGLEVIKVFSVGESFDFAHLTPYEGQVHYFLFDTQGKAPGGNGITFNWNALKAYPSNTPFFLSGGIGLDQVEAIKSLYNSFDKENKAHLFNGIDLNSKFELSPGIKQRGELEAFLRHIDF